MFVYVVIDTPNYPPGEQQAHSSYASAVFSKIMTEILPYLNIFPTKDLPENEAIQESLPSSEGINEPVSETEGAEEQRRLRLRQRSSMRQMNTCRAERKEKARAAVCRTQCPLCWGRKRRRDRPLVPSGEGAPRQSNESSTQAGPAGESTQATEPSSAGETAKPSE